MWPWSSGAVTRLGWPATASGRGPTHRQVFGSYSVPKPQIPQQWLPQAYRQYRFPETGDHPNRGATVSLQLGYEADRVSQLLAKWSDREVSAEAGSAILPVDQRDCLDSRYNVAAEVTLPDRRARQLQVSSPLPMLRPSAIVTEGRILCKPIFQVLGTIAAGANRVRIYI